VTGTQILQDVAVSYTWSTDNFPEDGSLHLLSPQGTEVVVAAGQPSGNYVQIVSDFMNEQGDGIWRMWIEDSYGDGGSRATNIEVTFTSNVNTFGWLWASATGTIPPGECIVVNVLFNAGDLLPGIYEGSVNITSNDPTQPLVEIPATLQVLAPGYVVCQPDTLWILTEAQLYEGVTATIFNPSDASVTIEEITNSSLYFYGWIFNDFSEELPVVLQPGDELTFNVTSDMIYPEVSLVYDYLNIVTSEGVVLQNIALDWELLSSVGKPNATSGCYPNPFASRLIIDVNSSAVSSMRILDINGKTIKRFTKDELSQNKIVWDARASSGVVTNGVYFVEVTSGDKKEIFKVLKTE
jgi:hypothetical protein